MSIQTLCASSLEDHFRRRLSSVGVSPEELRTSMGPTVVVPPKCLMACSEAHEVEPHSSEIEALRSSVSTPNFATDIAVTDKFAFAFDIDGVLLRGGKVILEAVEAMRVLNGHNQYGIKVL